MHWTFSKPDSHPIHHMARIVPEPPRYVHRSQLQKPLLVLQPLPAIQSSSQPIAAVEVPQSSVHQAALEARVGAAEREIVTLTMQLADMQHAYREDVANRHQAFETLLARTEKIAEAVEHISQQQPPVAPQWPPPSEPPVAQQQPEEHWSQHDERQPPPLSQADPPATEAAGPSTSEQLDEPCASSKPPKMLRLTGKRKELTMEQEEYLGDYRLIRSKREPLKWQHTRYRNLFIARAPSGTWYAQEKKHLGKGKGQLMLSDKQCTWPHQSSVVWKSADGSGGWYDQPSMKLRHLKGFKRFLAVCCA